MIRIEEQPPRSAVMLALIRELDADLLGRYPKEQSVYDKHNDLSDECVAVVAWLNGEAVGCGVYRPVPDNEAAVELKRMFVQRRARGRGIGKRLILELEGIARQRGFTLALLQTGVRQPEAIGLYSRQGYVRIPNYAPYEDDPMSVCMEKSLVITG